ncbi:MAG: S9 family peptidase, partial [Caulobacteraceae bacterium]
MDETPPPAGRQPLPAPPVAEKRPERIEQLGRVRTDDYGWMKDADWQKVMRDPQVLRPDIRAHLDAENAYTKAMLASTEGLQAQIFSEMRGRIKEDDSSVPSPDGPFEYYARYQTGAQHPIYARRPRGHEDGEEVLIDADVLAQGKAFFDIGEAEHSDDHTLFAYAVDEQGSEYFTIQIKDLATGYNLPNPVESSTGAFVFSPDSAWLFWIWRDENGRPAKVFRRPARGGEDVLVYEEADDGMFLSIGVTSDSAYIVIGSGDHETSEVRILAASDPTGATRIVEPRSEGVRYEVDHWDGRFVILTNADAAVDYKLVWADEANPGKLTWRDWIAHQPGRYIVGMTAHKGWFVRLERVDANARIVIAARGSLDEHTIAFDEPAHALGIEGGYEFDTPTLRFVYQSPTTPRSTFDYDMATRARILRKTQEIPSGHNPSDYIARRLHAVAPDGARVPITVLMRADTELDGSAPLLLYGYGAYGLSMEPSFSIRSLSLVDRGWIWATAHIRGGTEKGYGWFLDGRGEKKPNTFNDFIACAEHLNAEGYGAPGRNVAYGGSAGGMLMGAVANLRPELWAGVIAAVPFVDVLNTMSDA